ncbi:putative membrane protein [Rubricella aquisinus]|uniref:Putative membrane protein n=1 Tax=Rubricella aquisinus TaxID=2028108 RepID=A0A840WS53_9RHOB|nr:TIGR01620 family protein [Rubricella aquisinus]MBB5516853.1 putative membrane protein [Rubricella aquisinus]
MTEQPPTRGPVVIDIAEEDTFADTPATAAPITDDLPAVLKAARIGPRKSGRGWLGTLFLSSLLLLITTAATVAAWDFGVATLARNPVLGLAVAGLGAVAALTLVLMILREVAALARLRSVDALRSRAALARAGGMSEAQEVSKAVRRLYANRADTRWARDMLAEKGAEQVDADALLDLTERAFLAPLDRIAAEEVRNATRQVAAATALVPLALADILVALTANTRMIRRIAECYGARAGLIGSWRLFRAVGAHLIATGAVAVGDDLISSIVGGGMLSKLSRRFGEGVVNGALTARVGVAAMEVCRPMPFEALKRPSVSGIVQTALTGLFQKSSADGA